MRYIDADKLSVYFEALANMAEAEGLFNLAHINKRYLRLVEEAPTADVVEVVRCKDCKHWEEEGIDYLTQRPFGSCKCPYWEHPTEYFSMSDNDYCSYGERRSDDEG